MEANETLLQIGLQYCRLPTHTDTKETYSTLHIQPHRCTRVCVMCYFDSLLLPLQSLAHFLSTNHLSPSPHLSFLLLPSPSNPEVGREGGREEGREETGERKKEGGRQGVGREQWVGGGEAGDKKPREKNGERQRRKRETCC